MHCNCKGIYLYKFILLKASKFINGCLNIHRTHVTANYSKDDNVMFRSFF